MAQNDKVRLTLIAAIQILSLATGSDSSEECPIENHSGFLKRVCGSNKFQCANSTTKYTLTQGGTGDKETFSEACPSDPLFYQACGLALPHNTSMITSLCGHHVCAPNNVYTKPFAWTDPDCRSSPGTFSLVCDGKCDIERCEDERTCGAEYGMTCRDQNGESKYLPQERLCDGVIDCNSEDDEKCEVVSGEPTCVHNRTGALVPLPDSARCGILKLDTLDENFRVGPYCRNFMEQTNCTDERRVGGICKVDGQVTNISKMMVCAQHPPLCDENSENNCVGLSGDCPVHKHRLCDNVDDCPDGSDEKRDECDAMTKSETCVRLFGELGKSQRFPRAWIMDGEADCLDGTDEQEGNWKICKYEGNISHVLDEGETACKDVFRCPKGDKIVDYTRLCDSVESCGDENENDICTESRDFPEKQTRAKTVNGKKDLGCLSNCEEKTFIYPTMDILGVSKTTLLMPTSKQNCSKLFGELYLYLSCMNHCNDSTPCLLQNQPEVLKHDACPGQFTENKVFTLADNNKLTFAVNDSKGDYHQQYFQCQNGRCVDFSQVCDLVDNCGDMSDEVNCTNHFQCRGDNNHLVGLSQKCDGIYDCLDLSDECNNNCGRRIVQGGESLTPICWIIGILGILLNCATLILVGDSLKKCRNENILFSKVLVMMISAGDLILGTYLVTLSVYDGLVYKDKFCSDQARWLSGTECAVLGLLSTIGSQLSLFSMTVLSVFRLLKVVVNTLPLQVSRKSVIRTSCWAGGITLLSIAIAAIPLIPADGLEDYFVQGIYYENHYRLFVGLNSKQKHVQIIQEYVNKTTEPEIISQNPSWVEIGRMVDDMFAHSPDRESVDIVRNKVHFYGNDGLCLFKYIVRSDDARRTRQGDVPLDNDPVVWAILGLNLVCFVFILLSATIICVKTRRSAERTGQKKNKATRKRNRDLEMRIVVIVATDFICWVPFIIICFLHNQSVVDVSGWYHAIALIILPLNSLINPLIYDKTITSLCQDKVKKLAESLGWTWTTGQGSNNINNRNSLHVTSGSPKIHSSSNC